MDVDDAGHSTEWTPTSLDPLGLAGKLRVTAWSYISSLVSSRGWREAWVTHSPGYCYQILLRKMQSD